MNNSYVCVKNHAITPHNQANCTGQWTLLTAFLFQYDGDFNSFDKLTDITNPSCPNNNPTPTPTTNIRPVLLSSNGTSMPHDGATNVPTTATLILKYEDADNDAMLPYNDPAAMVPLSIVDDNGVVVSANGMWDGQDQLTFYRCKFIVWRNLSL